MVYKIYDTNNHSLLIDTQAKYEVTYQNEAAAKAKAEQTKGYEIIKDTMPEQMRANIEKNLGKIEYSNERAGDRGHFAIVKDKQTNLYSTLKIEKEPEGHRINVKSGFPDKEQAYNYLDREQKHDIAQDLSKKQSQELSR
ncbi:hypothetical protein [Peribacillus asahii]|uniref:hypothetical protein n=1 Tax=Peribacillus asahii TaxID=228899 RepID=UPI0020796CE7|nr:hypothetical protein [Peribacillus asahii]USK72635.1 hypothetical protein LIS76_23610 [Peribacillus asahii]USK72751.1 hypothetical protein LIS76_23790 [Peribacillus asahii]